MNSSGIAGMLLLALGGLVGASAGAAASDQGPCDLIARNEIAPGPSIAATDRYADLMTMFGRAPEMRNLTLRRLKSAADFHDLLDLIDKGGGKGKWRAAVAALRDVVAHREEVVWEEESSGELSEDRYPFTEAERVFVLDERGVDGLPQPIYFMAEDGNLVVLTFEGGKRRPQITAVRSLGDFERFGVFELGGTRLVYRLVRGKTGDGRGRERVEVFPLTPSPAQPAGTAEQPVCFVHVTTATIHRLEAYVAAGAKAPQSDIFPGLSYMLASLLDRPAAGNTAEGQVALQILDSSGGATRGVWSAAPTETLATETQRDPETMAASLAAIGLDRSAVPGVSEVNAAAPNIRGLIGTGGWDLEMLVLADPRAEDPTLCAVYGDTSGNNLDAWSSLNNSGRVSGLVACTILPPGKPEDAASAIIAGRAAAGSGDGLAYSVIESEIILGLPSAN